MVIIVHITHFNTSQKSLNLYIFYPAAIQQQQKPIKQQHQQIILVLYCTQNMYNFSPKNDMR